MEKVRVALYLRLSDEDNNKFTKKELSESIKNQENMLKKYSIENNWNIVGIYNDEDYSGADSNRPEFNKMIKECESGNIDIVLCKTQSRFTRDMELVEKYLHNKFIEWNVRFISLVDSVDTSNKGNKKQRQIIGLTNEWYLEDTSENIRQTLKNKRENGEFTGSFAPYGYKKDPMNKNHLIIDEVVADTIKRIFNEYSNGYSLNKILKGLCDDNIPSPFEYKMMNNCKLKIPIIKNYVNYNCIDKSGTYILKINYFNNTRRILCDLITINFLTDNDISFSNKFDIKLIKISNNIKLFYSTKNLYELDIDVKNNNFVYTKFNFDNVNLWTPFTLNTTIPNNISCIATYTDNLDRMNEISYGLEVTLKENRSHTKFFYKMLPNYEINLDLQIRNKYKWNEQTIKKILRDEVYIGNLVQFKTTNISYKNKKVIHNDMSKWIRVLHTHEPIIDTLLWKNVQERIKNRKKACITGKVHILANKVFCMECGKVFCKCGKNDINGKAYLCCKDKYTKWSNCSNKKYIKEIELQEFIVDKFNKLLKRFFDENIIIDLNNIMIDDKLFKDKITNLKCEKTNIDKQFINKNSIFQQLYEDRKNGFLDNSEYLILKNKYKEDYTFLENRYNKVIKELDKINKQKIELKNSKNLFKKYKIINQLNNYIVNNFIDKILIGNYDENTNKREIKIIWNFFI